MTEPTTGEVMRRLDNVAAQLERVATELREDRKLTAELYLRKDVHTSMHASVLQRVGDLEAAEVKREARADAFRRQIIVGLVLLAVPALGSLVLAVNNLTGAATP